LQLICAALPAGQKKTLGASALSDVGCDREGLLRAMGLERVNVVGADVASGNFPRRARNANSGNPVLAKGR
jgi:hypothetical protein